MEQDLKELALAVLGKGYVMSLSTIDSNGPWVSDVIYVFDDALNLYWVSNTDRQHSISISKDPRVSASITVSDGSDGRPEEALQISGIAERLDTDPHDLGVMHRAKRRKPVPESGKGILDANESWYCLRPARIELFYGKLFGWERKRVL